MPKGFTISPLNQSGSWMLDKYMVVVARPGFGSPPISANPAEEMYFVEIVTMPDNERIAKGGYLQASEPCEAALYALVYHLGGKSDAVKEFKTHYECLNYGRKPGYKMDDDLDSVSDDLPVWIRR